MTDWWIDLLSHYYRSRRMAWRHGKQVWGWKHWIARLPHSSALLPLVWWQILSPEYLVKSCSCCYNTHTDFVSNITQRRFTSATVPCSVLIQDEAIW